MWTLRLQYHQPATGSFQTFAHPSLAVAMLFLTSYHLWYLGGSSLRAGGNGTAGTTMAVPVFEGEKFTLVPSTQCWDSLQVLQYATVFAYSKRSKTGAGEGLASFPGPARSSLTVRNSLREFRTASDERAGPGNDRTRLRKISVAWILTNLCVRYRMASPSGSP